jgi:hypothetical protein
MSLTGALSAPGIARQRTIEVMRRPSNRGIRLFLWLFVMVGALATGCGAWNLLRSLECERWPTTEGVIETGELNYQSSDDGNGTYSASVSYRYQVAGRHYTSTRVAFGQLSSSAAHAQAILNRFPPGRTVPVHYESNNPEQAVLETRIHGGTWVCFAVGIVFLLAGWMFLGLPSRNSAAQSEAAPQQPPKLMGVIFIVMGSFVCFSCFWG